MEFIFRKNEKIHSLESIRDDQDYYSIINRRRVHKNNSKMYYSLIDDLYIQLSDGDILLIEKGFEWDLSSVPRMFWGILPPDGDFELASLIHDALYISKFKSRKFADKEMLIWSKAVSGTNSKVSFRNFDNQLRFVGVHLFGWVVWNRKRKNDNYKHLFLNRKFK